MIRTKRSPFKLTRKLPYPASNEFFGTSNGASIDQAIGSPICRASLTPASVAATPDDPAFGQFSELFEHRWRYCPIAVLVSVHELLAELGFDLIDNRLLVHIGSPFELFNHPSRNVS